MHDANRVLPIRGTDLHRRRLVAIWQDWRDSYRAPIGGWAGIENFRDWFLDQRTELERRAINNDRAALGRDAAAIRRFIAAGGELRVALNGIDNMASTRRQQLAQLDALIKELADLGLVDSDAVVEFDSNLILTSWDDGAERTFAWTAAEAIGHPVADKLPGDGDRMGRIGSLMTDGYWHGEVVVADRDGAHVAVEATVRRDAEGNFRSVIRRLQESDLFEGRPPDNA